MTIESESVPLHTDASAVDAHAAADPEKLSELLERLARTAEEKVSIREIDEALNSRSFGAFLVVFALPNLIPLPPGATLFLGLPMVVIAWQMVMGYRKVWLPNALGAYSVERGRFRYVVGRITPWLSRTENWIRPRNWPIKGLLGQRLFGLFSLILAIICVMPIPFGNWPPAFAIAILGIAHAERDGNCLAIGVIAGLAAIMVASLVVLATGALLMRIF